MGDGDKGKKGGKGKGKSKGATSGKVHVVSVGLIDVFMYMKFPVILHSAEEV